MAKAKTTVTIEGRAAQKLAELAAASGRSEDFYAAYMIEEYAAREMQLIASIKEAQASIDRGEGIPHEEARRRFQATIDRAKRPAAE
ncbi:hypothetical protein [Aureimonas sp. SA4125]|uniref:hypothetical protein n=1 Tax=Aureimonas sp. SA4125 TaxID=2826993 RepID=UPI001CC62C4E|nr:hypothetical protein [Aureimonas sp. SA4125]